MDFTWQVPRRTIPDRRRFRRFSVRQPVTVKCELPFPSDMLSDKYLVQSGVSRDISRNGVFVWLRDRISIGTVVQVTMMAPSEIFVDGHEQLRWTGHVVRVEHDFDRAGVAIMLDRVEVADALTSTMTGR